MTDMKTSNRCYILEIPPELRLQIYDEILAPITIPKGKDFSLLNTCKLIRNEALAPFLDKMERISDELDWAEQRKKIETTTLEYELTAKGLLLVAQTLISMEPQSEQVDRCESDSERESDSESELHSENESDSKSESGSENESASESESDSESDGDVDEE
ncbi:hypothetical protein PRZ48_012484 [Zasmidium cellare]|uniref:Uncharacterized protein n=1 Tax=Zasmidium cellare TaxID=395010 RepID=A0ABR0E501_ZASCE|nr:hypothetical protein PRZ48_012484 [Zasmidium cellare]